MELLNVSEEYKEEVVKLTKEVAKLKVRSLIMVDNC